MRHHPPPTVYRQMETVVTMLCQALLGQAMPEAWGGLTAAEWDRLAMLAANHGVETLLCQRFTADGWPAPLPAAARQKLRAAAYTSRAHNLQLYQELGRLLALLTPLTPLVLLKGAALGPGLYAQPALRPLTDLDLLVPSTALAAVTSCLLAHGYRMVPSLAPELLPQVEPHIALLGGPGGDLSVELHWGLTAGSADWRAAPIDWFWQQTEPWAAPTGFVAQAGALRFSPTAQLLHLAAHLVLRHGNTPTRLIWVYDLHLLVGQSPIDWPLLVAQARALGWGAVVVAALAQASQCFGTPVPTWVLNALHEPLDARTAFYGPASTSYRLRTTWSDLAQIDLPIRLRLLLRVIFPSRAYLRANYQPVWGKLWPLAYPYRWLKPLRVLINRVRR